MLLKCVQIKNKKLLRIVESWIWRSRTDFWSTAAVLYFVFNMETPLGPFADSKSNTCLWQQSQKKDTEVSLCSHPGGVDLTSCALRRTGSEGFSWRQICPWGPTKT